MPQPLTRHAAGETSHRWPDLLPDGDSLLFAAGQATANFVNGARIVLQSIATGERRDLIQAATFPRYVPSGHLIYAQAGNLMAVPFDLQRRQVTGTAVPVVESVAQLPGSGVAQYAISPTGSLAYVSGGIQQTQSILVWVSRNGTEQPLIAPVRDYRVPRLSPDGRRIAVAIDDQETQVWLYDISRDALSRSTFEGNANLHHLWTPDGKWIAFQSNQEGPQNLFWQLADGSGGLERLTTSESVHIPASFSPDGQLLALSESSATVSGDISVLQISDRKVTPFLRTAFTESAPMFSPDGRWLAYVSNESGRNEVYVQPYPGPGGKWPISTGGGIEPRWNPNGRELFYRNGDRMMVVDITTQPAFSAGNPRLLFEGQYARNPADVANYDISPDGQRFLMVKETPQAGSAAQINVILNWFEDLQRLSR
jgi:Tol biopolymer transport system component